MRLHYWHQKFGESDLHLLIFWQEHVLALANLAPILEHHTLTVLCTSCSKKVFEAINVISSRPPPQRSRLQVLDALSSNKLQNRANDILHSKPGIHRLLISYPFGADTDQTCTCATVLPYGKASECSMLSMWDAGL